jgi:hypothetical protein
MQYKVVQCVYHPFHSCKCALQLSFLLQTLADHASAVVPGLQSCISCPVDAEPVHRSMVKKRLSEIVRTRWRNGCLVDLQTTGASLL